MDDASPLDEPVLSKNQTLWIIVTLGWFVIGIVTLALGRSLYGIAALLVGLVSGYRIFNPG